MKPFKGSRAKNLFWSAFFYELQRSEDIKFSDFVNDDDSHSQGVNAARQEILLAYLGGKGLPDSLVKYPKNLKTLGVGKKLIRQVIGESFGFDVD